jgi:hypothetical protein
MGDRLLMTGVRPPRYTPAVCRPPQGGLGRGLRFSHHRGAGAIMSGKYGRILVENGLVPVFRHATTFHDQVMKLA